MRSRFLLSIPLLCALAAAGACDSGGPASTTDGAGGSGAGGPGAGGSDTNTDAGTDAAPAAVCTDPTEIACADQVIQEMNLKNEAAPGGITSEPDNGGFRSTIDATAGGAFAAKPHSYVYGKFTEAGLEKVNISDEESLASMDWDIAFRRYVVRINSGDSGPSCVTAARVPGKVAYDEFTEEPSELLFRTDDYFTESCELIPDGSGLENSPATALSSYWSYPGCVAMTDHVFVVELRDGRHVKLNVVGYYKDLDAQKTCNETGAVPMGTAGATMLMRWAFLP